MHRPVLPSTNWNSQLYERNHAFVWQLSENLVDLLLPQPNEQILDIGCGTGQLTAKIAASRAKVTGIDSSETMIATAKQNYPDIEFIVADARNFRSDSPVDAIFSNATLHWIHPPEAVVRSIHHSLKSGGRFVAEFGGKGNIKTILQALQSLEQIAPIIKSHQQHNNPWYFPSVSEYTNLLEANGFEVTYATLFDRPTPLDGESGLANWLQMFANSWLHVLSPEEQKTLIQAIEDRLRPVLYQNGTWIADYRRIRVMAIKVG